MNSLWSPARRRVRRRAGPPHRTPGKTLHPDLQTSPNALLGNWLQRHIELGSLFAEGDHRTSSGLRSGSQTLRKRNWRVRWFTGARRPCGFRALSASRPCVEGYGKFREDPPLAVSSLSSGVRTQPPLSNAPDATLAPKTIGLSPPEADRVSASVQKCPDGTLAGSARDHGFRAIQASRRSRRGCRTDREEPLEVSGGSNACSRLYGSPRDSHEPCSVSHV